MAPLRGVPPSTPLWSAATSRFALPTAAPASPAAPEALEVVLEARPRFTADEALALFRTHWAGAATGVEALPSYDDQNWLVALASGGKVVLKVAAVGAECRGGAGAAETAASLRCEGAMMAAVGASGVACPRVVEAAKGGAEIVAAVSRGVDCFARVVTFVDGAPLSTLRAEPLGSGLAAAVGAAAARVRGALAPSEPRADGGDAETRVLAWDLANASRLTRPYLGDVDDGLRGPVSAALDRFDALLATEAFAKLPKQLIHGDLNDENLHCARGADGSWRVGVLDFGDFVRTYRVFDLAILLAYALFDGGPDAPPDAAAAAAVLDRGAALVAAYHAEAPLLEAEVDALPTLVAARNCQTILNSAHAYKMHPDPYVLVSAQPATRLLRTLALVGDAAAKAKLKEACGMGVKRPPVPAAKANGAPTPPAPVAAEAAEATEPVKKIDDDKQDVCNSCAIL